MNAIDTNVIAYTFDATAPVKQAAARELLFNLVLNPSETVLLWQVAVEFLACLRKAEIRGLLNEKQGKMVFREVIQLFTLVSPTAAVFERSFVLHAQYSLFHWDSLLVAACQEASVVRLYSEDMQHGANYDGVNIVNPFV